MGARMLLLISVGMALFGGLHAVAPTGRQFITAFMQNYKMDHPGAQFQLFISGYASSTRVTVSIYKSQFRGNFILTRGQTQVVTIPKYAEMPGTAKFCNTVLVEADQDVSVLALNSKQNSADTNVVYPVDSLGTEYFILTPPGDGTGLYKEFSIIAWREAVEVEIYLKGSVRFQQRIYKTGTKLSVSLLPYEAVQFQSRQDLSGTRIRSSQPVAVLSGHSCARLNTKCNHVVEQLLPVTSWGRSFFVPPLSFQTKYDIAYIVASQSTLVTYFSGGTHKNQLVMAGTVFQLKVTPSAPLYISASAGIQVFFFCTGGSYNRIAFDPFLLNIPDTSSYCTSYSLRSQTGFENYALVIAKKAVAAAVAMDGKPLGGVSWKPIPGSEYVWREYSLGEASSQYTVGHPDTPFGLLSFGIANQNGYGAVALCQSASLLPPKPSCNSVQCRKKESCQIINDRPVCVPQSSGICWAMGDPHYRTFDKQKYNFMGTCTYTMAKTCGSDSTLPPFHITAKNENRGRKTVSYVGSVTVQVYGYHISVARNERGLVRVNNQRSRLPISLHDGKLRLYQSGRLVVIETNFLLKVSYDWNHYLLVKISSSFFENVCGLCGNYNGDPADDFKTASGSLAPSPVEFGHSWKVEDGDSLCQDDCHGECKKVTVEVLIKYKVELFCGWISKKEGGPFSHCHSVLDPEIFVDNCAYDLYIYGGYRQALCQALETYADACQREGVVLSDWRTLTGCPMACPENSHYKLCGSACPATCNDQATPTNCSSLACVETCQCDEGFVMDAGKCIPRAACGCVFEGRLFPPKEEFWGDSTCTKRCICDPQTKQVTCQRASCKSGEHCQIQNGIQNCYPTGFGTCAAIGHSHYHTFDGQHFNFQGTCLYQFAGLSKKSQELVDFQVLVQNARQGGGSPSLNKLVKVQVYGIEITLSWAYRGRIMPNETVLLNDCQEVCRCIPGRGVICESHSCGSDETCKTQDGIMSCINRDPCKSLTCRTKETCKLENGRATCVPLYNETCWGWGDPHYHTFDGREIDFQGTCTYTIAKYCGNDSTLVPFRVDEKNDNRGSQAISFVKMVNIYIREHNISIRRKEFAKIRLNGAITNLPVTLDDGKTEIFQSGLQAILQTDFGLVVSFDWSSLVEITLPSSYYGAICGLCGNFNQNPDDDMAMPTGKVAASAVEWGRSWKVKDRDPFCWDFCAGDCPVCEEQQRRLFESEEFCGLIAKADGGPFRECHSKLNPDDFFDSCVYDVCLNGGAKNILCQALSAYATNCRKEGVILQDWRAQSGCALPCPENSHYEACGNACPASCADRSAPQTCSMPCLETCQCNDGYVLSADKCVPVGTCGCTHDGLYYKPGEEFWADENCSSRCRCDPSLGLMVCQPASCKPSERCAVVDGIRGCHPRSHATCSASGDHHFTTFDGKRYDFTGTCIYQAVGLCSKESGLTPFTITIQNSQGSKTAPFSSVVTLEVYGRTITISQEQPHTIQVDGMFVDLPFYHEDKVKAYISGAHVLVTTKFDLAVTFGWNRLVRITIPSTYFNAVCGLCGNDNAEPGDDLTMKDGQRAANAAQFAESWKVGEIPGCVNGCTSNCPVCEEAQKRTYEGDQYCGILTRKDGPFKDCHKAVDPAPYVSDCVFDVCHYKGHHSILCHAISAYVTACQAQGIQIGQWRSASFCSLSCPRNSHYDLCGNGCPTTCHSLSAPDGCQQSCKEGCYCNAGFVLSGDECVPIGECGCVHQGRYYKKGAAFFPSHSCQERCRCTDNGVVECQSVSCGDNEECGVQHGVRGCHPIGCGKCSLSGGSHFLTFDRQIINFSGSCTYVLAKVCSGDPGLVPFSVVIENESVGKVVTKEVVVTVHGYTINLVKGMNGKIQVDGETFALPLVIGRRMVWVNQEGKNIIIQTDFGLKVLCDSSYYVLVSVPSTYRGHMCGLCGNFNGDKSDEFLLPDEKTTQNVTEFGMSWKVPVQNAACSDGCGQNCPNCASIKTSPYQAENSCGLILAQSGPFRDCHPLVRAADYFDLCLYSMCVASGAKEILCQSLQAYMTVCQAAGAKIEAWRMPSFCPLSCPANSHYESCSRSCDLTCAGLSAAPSLCTQKCFEGCQCDAGYMSDGETCVPMERCGCVYNGHYIKAEESVVSKDCSEKCTCHASGRLTCAKVTCKTGEACAVKNGQRGCVKQEAQCALAVGGQLTTFDGASGEILYTGVYEVASLCNVEDRSWFRVIVDVKSCSDGEVMAGAAIYVFFRETFIAINKNKETWVNGKPAQLPVTTSEAVSVRLSQDVVTISQGTALQVLFGLRGEVTVKVKASLEGKLCASCGNFNGDNADDLRLPNGKIVGDIAEVIDAWRARDFSGCE
ncbi:IgGFc-binding protein-like [Sphaerodactylus townsendi]|nr:IgGFc-binding protein-like [Sphaerodactylus townsendi]